MDRIMLPHFLLLLILQLFCTMGTENKTICQLFADIKIQFFYRHTCYLWKQYLLRNMRIEVIPTTPFQRGTEHLKVSLQGIILKAYKLWSYSGDLDTLPDIKNSTDSYMFIPSNLLEQIKLNNYNSRHLPVLLRWLRQ